MIVRGFPFDPKRPITEKPPFYIVVVNGIIVAKSEDGSRIVQWAIDHHDDVAFDLVHYDLDEERGVFKVEKDAES